MPTSWICRALPKTRGPKPRLWAFAFTRTQAALLIALAAPAALAQTAPDAGALRQQLEQSKLPALPARGAPEPSPPAMAALPAAGEAIFVRDFSFAGNQLVAAEDLIAAVQQFAGRELRFAELQAAAAAAAAVYRQRGWVVRVYLPEQDISDGRVRLQVVEAVFGRVRIDGSSQRLSAGTASSFVDAAQAAGAPVNGNALDRALLLIDDLPGVSATGRLGEGRNDRETDLQLTLRDGPLLSGSVTADNAGSRSTGPERLIAQLDLSSPLRFGDQASLVLLKSQGNEFARLAYAAPLGSSGWRLGVNTSSLRYRVITAEFAALEAHGRSDSLGADVSFPLLRTRTDNVLLNFAYDNKRFDNRSAGVIATRYTSHALASTMAFNRFDEFFGGGATSGALGWVSGKLDLTGSPNEAADAASTRTAGGFNKLRLTASRQQQLSDDMSLYASFTGQLASKNLDSSEKFYLGGVSGVRAYPTSEAGGSSGHLVNVELRARLPYGVAGALFYDRGAVKVNQNNDIPTALPQNNWSVAGAGASLTWTAPFGLSTRLTFARRLGTNPNATSGGLDQDGTLKKTRVWLQATMPF